MKAMSDQEIKELENVTGGTQSLAGAQDQSTYSNGSSSCPKGGQHEWIQIDSSMRRCAKCNMFVTV